MPNRRERAIAVEPEPLNYVDFLAKTKSGYNPEKFPMFIKEILKQEKGFVPLLHFNGKVLPQLIAESKHWNYKPIYTEVLDVQPLNKNKQSSQFDFHLAVPAYGNEVVVLRREAMDFYENFRQSMYSHYYTWHRQLVYSVPSIKGTKFAHLKDRLSIVLDRLSKKLENEQGPNYVILDVDANQALQQNVEEVAVPAFFQDIQHRIYQIMADPDFRANYGLLNGRDFEQAARDRAMDERDGEVPVAQPRVHRAYRNVLEDVEYAAIPEPENVFEPDPPNPYEEDWGMDPEDLL